MLIYLFITVFTVFFSFFIEASDNQLSPWQELSKHLEESKSVLSREEEKTNQQPITTIHNTNELQSMLNGYLLKEGFEDFIKEPIILPSCFLDELEQDFSLFEKFMQNRENLCKESHSTRHF